MKVLSPYIDAHHESVYRKRSDGRLHDIRSSWWVLMKTIRVYEPKINSAAWWAWGIGLFGVGALLGGAAVGWLT